MINGAHLIIYTRTPTACGPSSATYSAAVRRCRSRLADLRPAAGRGGRAPDGRRRRHELYLMCDDIDAAIEELGAKGVEFSRPIEEERWGLVTAIRLPGGVELGLYEPRHPTPPH